jgi:hypothetical protein
MMRRLAAGTILVAALIGCRHRAAPPPAAPGAAPPAAPRAHEVCGNCVDDDADGRTDFEDAACCPHPATLEGSTLIVAPAARPQDPDVFTLTTRIPPGVLTEPNPLLDDVTVQLRAGGRERVCAAIGHQFWRKTGQSYRFHPHGGRTRELPETFVRVLPTGAVAVHVKGLRSGLARQADGEWQVTVRIGDGCAAAAIRPAASGGVR